MLNYDRGVESKKYDARSDFKDTSTDEPRSHHSSEALEENYQEDQGTSLAQELEGFDFDGAGFSSSDENEELQGKEED